jgi:mRNA-degrading endonuclease RelE of RelBE toxin-antitoxin system
VCLQTGPQGPVFCGVRGWKLAVKMDIWQTIQYQNFLDIFAGKYRAIFYVDNNGIMIIALDKREDIYKKWQ